MPGVNPIVLPPVRGGPAFDEWVAALEARAGVPYRAALVVRGLEALARELDAPPPPRRVGPPHRPRKDRSRRGG